MGKLKDIQADFEATDMLKDDDILNYYERAMATLKDLIKSTYKETK